MGLRERKKQKTRPGDRRGCDAAFRRAGLQRDDPARSPKRRRSRSARSSTTSRKARHRVRGMDAIVESARARIVERPAGEAAIEAVFRGSATVLPEVERAVHQAIRRLPEIVASDPSSRRRSGCGWRCSRTCSRRPSPATSMRRRRDARARDRGNRGRRDGRRVERLVRASRGRLPTSTSRRSRAEGGATCGALAAGLQAIEMLPPQPGA